MESSKLKKLKPQVIHLVSETDSEEFNLLNWAVNHSSVIGFDAEWKPSRTKPPPFPTVSLLQIACRVNHNSLDYIDSQKNDMLVFIVDLLNMRLSSIWELLRDMFISPDILKLGFHFKHDLIYLSSTFCSQGCNPGFDRVEPYLDISSIYNHLRQKEPGGNLSKETKGLATICEEVLGVFLPKELQRTDWSHRPLTEDQKTYAAADAQCLMEIFTVFQGKILKEGYSSQDITECQPANTLLGSKEILVNPDTSDLRVKFCTASDIVTATTVSEIAVAPISRASCKNTVPLGVPLSEIVRKYGERILLKERARKPKNVKEKGKRQSSVGLGKGQSSVGKGYKKQGVKNCSHRQGPPSLDLSLGGDGCPKDKLKKLKPQEIHLVSETDSEEFNLLSWALSRSSVIGLDAEWKRAKQPPFPTVSLLQIACRVNNNLEYTDSQNDMLVFLVDLLKIRLSSIWELLRDMFISPDILKLGFLFQPDLVYLSSTFCSHGCNPDFDRVEPYLDISSIYHHLQQKEPGGMLSKDTKGLGAICEEVLGVFHSKELRFSDWSHRPLTEDQKTFAAANAQCLLEIFTVFQRKILKEGYSSQDITESQFTNTLLGPANILGKPDASDVKLKFCQSSDIIRSPTVSEIAVAPISRASYINTLPLGFSLSEIVQKYGGRMLLKEWGSKPKTSNEKEKIQSSVDLGKRQSSVGLGYEEKRVENCSQWNGPPPWDLSLGGDGCPKFLCDFTVKELAKHLRCVGVDAEISYSKRTQPRELINQARRVKRVLLTQDAKLLGHECLIRNQVYRVKSLPKNDQLLEVIETFKLKISKDQLMSRCTQCNGRFIHKPLTTEEAKEAVKGFQAIPNYAFNRNLDFWQCTDCNRFSWEVKPHNLSLSFHIFLVPCFLDVKNLRQETPAPVGKLLDLVLYSRKWFYKIGTNEVMSLKTCQNRFKQRKNY
ncbi:3'-5' exonuclease domain [Macleaya cordata]|uniref:3'-5' exonuclease domain n=1 Tax=Macleaya cordata TaxID=56857 RepID=A0A200Q767_MACCD|nr:3'-5' exonuclease domain [Macleaya cordata]